MAKALEDVKMNYDAKADVLYCSFVGEPREAIGVEADDGGIIVRLDPQTDEVIGITILDFSKRFIANPGNTLSFNEVTAAVMSQAG